MTATSSPVNAGRILAALLAEQGTLASPQAVELVRKLAGQVAALHDGGRLHLAISADAVLVDEVLQPVLVVSDPGSEVPIGASAELLPELAGLLVPELPTGMAAARERLRAAGIALDPRHIDLCQLGALFCRMLTGESAAAYLRSARVKGQVPVELRSILEQALGCDGQKRFSDMEDFRAALNAFVNQPTALVESAVLDADATAGSAVEPSSASRPAGDTTPSFVASADKPADTSVGPGQPLVAQSSAVAAHKSESPLPFARLGHYEIVARIGHGGMGDVYRGYERALDREVAIKVLPAELARSDDFVRRFRTEATAVAKLNHPNIVPIHFIGEDQGHHFYAMQYVEGESLAELLARRGKLSAAETLPIVEQALAGLVAAHDHGMVHRDIKPGNILLDRRSRRALLADFGLVKSLESSVSGKTATGVIMGTVDYISPEQGRGLAVDGRSDLYSLGVLLYLMLSGRLPFTGDSPTALIFQHVYEPPPSLQQVAPDVPEPLAAVVARLLAKSPGDRHQSAEEVLADLRAFRSGQPLPSRGAVLPGRQTTIIRLPSFDEETPLLPEGLSDLKPLQWWEKTRERAKSLFHRHAPEVLQQLQNTQQQVDGAVAVYERRRCELQQLADDAQSVLMELQKQAGEQRAAAAAAGERAGTAEDPEIKSQAHDEQRSCERAAAELDRQIADQQEQLEPIQLQLAQAQARVGELKNQRDILNARLKAANAERYLATGSRPAPLGKLGRQALKVALVVLLGPVVFGIVRYVTAPGGSTEQGEEIVTDTAKQQSDAKVNDASPTTSGAPQSAPLVAAATPYYSNLNVVEKQLALSRDGALLVTFVHSPPKLPGDTRPAKPPDEMQLWDLATGQAVLSLEQPHHALRMAVSPDVNSLFSVGTAPKTELGEFKLWDLKSGKVRHRHEASIPKHKTTAGFSPDSKAAYLLLGETLTEELGFVDVETGNLTRLRMPQSDDQASAAAFSPINDTAAIAVVFRPGARYAIDIHNLNARGIIHSLSPGNPVHGLEYSGDGRFLAGSSFGKVVVWESENWSQVESYSAGSSLYERIAVSFEGRFVAALSNKKVEIYDATTKKVAPLKVPFLCLDLAFTPGGTLIVAPDDSRFAFFDPETGKEQLTPMLNRKNNKP